MTYDKKNSKHTIGESSSSFFIKSGKPEMVLHFLVMAACTIVLLAGLKAASGIVAPMLLALFATIILLVPLRWLQSKGIPNILSVIMVLGCTVIVFLGIAFLVGNSLNDFLRQLPQYRKKIIVEVEKLDKKMRHYGFDLGFNKDSSQEKQKEVEGNVEGDHLLENLENIAAVDTLQGDSFDSLTASHHETEKPAKHSEKVPETIQDGENGKNGQTDDLEIDEEEEADPLDLTGHPQNIDEILKQTKHGEEPSLTDLDINSVMYWITKFMLELKHLAEKGFLVMIITLFMIFEAARFPAKVDRAFGKGPITNEHFHRIAMEIRRYLFLKAISSMMSAVAAFSVYLFFGVPGAIMWGIIAFFLYFIPNIGGIVASIIPGLLIFMNLGVPGVLAYAVCLVAIECTIGYGIEPRILGHGLGISTVVIFLSLITWGWILGPIGLFLAAPLTIMVKIILQAFKETEWIAILLGDNSPHSHQTP